MKYNICKTNFEDVKEKVREMFSTPYILHCYSDDKCDVYRQIFQDETIYEVLHDEDILFTAKTFLQNDLTLSKAAKQGFVHRNTLIYRLDKIAKITGLDIRNFKDAVIFSNMLQVYDDLM